ncbi:hypothetical protein EMIT0P395_20168 [Pseudomonas sp. IT-P395]
MRRHNLPMFDLLMHLETFLEALSAISPARYVVASSTSLAHKLGNPLPSPAGLLVGPREEIAPDSGRLCSQVYTDGTHPRTGVVKWGVGDWNKSLIGTDGTLARK